MSGSAMRVTCEPDVDKLLLILRVKSDPCDLDPIAGTYEVSNKLRTAKAV